MAQVPVPVLPTLEASGAKVHKSTGPRTPVGKNRLALSAFPRSERTRFFPLRYSANAVIPAESFGGQSEAWWQRRLVSPQRRQDPRSSRQVVMGQKLEMQEQSRQIIENKGKAGSLP